MIVVLVHGWSVTSPATYGELPDRLRREAAAGRIPPVEIHDVWLGSYISFRNEVRLVDLARAFEAALQRTLGPRLAAGERIAVITHSTGGPVLREWWNRYCRLPGRPSPVSHLIMTAPANFGSALAQLGKERIGQLKSWLQDLAMDASWRASGAQAEAGGEKVAFEPGTGVLDWLELGSPEAFALGLDWIDADDPADGAAPFYQFVLAGQTIDRKLYDHVNAYTGETGSDGVVRVAAANLNCSHVRLEQALPPADLAPSTSVPLKIVSTRTSPRVAFTLIPGRAHSGTDRGMIASIRDRDDRHPTVAALRRCLTVDSPQAYRSLCDEFEARSADVREQERLDVVRHRLLPDKRYFRDAFTQVIVRVRDTEGQVPGSLDFKFTGSGNHPDHLPGGLFADRQRNHRDATTITFFLNADKMLGAPAVLDRGDIVRPAIAPVAKLGLQVLPRPRDGFVAWMLARLSASTALRDALLQRDRTTLVDLVLQRGVREGTFDLGEPGDIASDFRTQPKGGPIESA